MEHVVIVGGGFGGLYTAKNLARCAVNLTIIDKRNFHLFQPLLYQVATGGLSPGEIAQPIRRVLRRYSNVRVKLAEVTDIRTDDNEVVTADGTLSYDTLIVATGVTHQYFGKDQWENFAPGLKTVEDALEIRRRVLYAFEAAEREPDSDRRKEWLTIAVIGGGPTGVEMAGALSELARDTMRHDFRNFGSEDIRIILVEGRNRVLPTYPESLSLSALHALERLGVECLLNTSVTEITSDHITIAVHGTHRQVPARTICWAAGVSASPLGEILSTRTGAKLDGSGRILVQPDMTIAGRPEIFVIGDLASFTHQGEGAEPLPAVAPVAMQQGRYVARVIKNRIAGKTIAPFYYRNRGTLATIGRASAVADLGRARFSGYPAWLLWIFVHIAFLIGFENRLLVLIRWAWSYFTFNRGARLIAGKRGDRSASDPSAPGGGAVDW
ncbi:MAG: NAD(P)/FAD-dependent oxidoreductase [Gemmatimonadetes bacterium]|nr:NAD(P)/FAD-dependent oxidoreductase [Gemmatimonadota bacterium]